MPEMIGKLGENLWWIVFRELRLKNMKLGLDEQADPQLAARE